MKYNFSGFTSKANEALNLAISFAESMGHTYVGSEHLLLGLLKLGSGVAYSVLQKNAVTADKIEDLLKTQIGSGTSTRLSPDYFTPRAKKAIENAGGKVAGSVSAKTSYLINNDVASTSGKNKKAKELGIPIIDEDKIIEMLEI